MMSGYSRQRAGRAGINGRGSLDFFLKAWKETTLPSNIHYCMAEIERAAQAAEAMHEILDRDQECCVDVADNGVQYHGFNGRQRSALYAAQAIVLGDLHNNVDALRERSTPRLAKAGAK